MAKVTLKNKAKARAKSKMKKSGSGLKRSKGENLRWPQERQVLMRPERMRYVRKLLPQTSCVFCEAEKKGVCFEGLVLFKNTEAMVILNKYPYNSGHLLILPTRHVGNILELTDGEYMEVQMQLRRSIKAVIETYQCPALNVGLNHGQAAGAGIPEHLHWHVVPRWAGDTNFFPVIAESKVLVETLEQAYDRLKTFFNG